MEKENWVTVTEICENIDTLYIYNKIIIIKIYNTNLYIL